jgi:hypothetical protein
LVSDYSKALGVSVVGLGAKRGWMCRREHGSLESIMSRVRFVTAVLFRV